MLHLSSVTATECDPCKSIGPRPNRVQCMGLRLRIYRIKRGRGVRRRHAASLQSNAPENQSEKPLNFLADLDKETLQEEHKFYISFKIWMLTGLVETLHYNR